MNSIEYVFSMVKRNYRKLKMEDYVQQLGKPVQELIQESFDLIQKEKVANCIRHAEMIIMK